MYQGKFEIYGYFQFTMFFFIYNLKEYKLSIENDILVHEEKNHVLNYFLSCTPASGSPFQHSERTFPPQTHNQ